MLSEKGGQMKFNRSWLMVLCVLGMGSLFILPALGIGIGSLFGFLLFLLCPLSHLLMMRGMFGQKGGCHGQGEEPAPSPVKAPVAIEDGTSSKA
jgi:hypothetical protein